MADRFWVGGTGVWSDNLNHWSASSGGAPNASKPGASDPAIFDGASGGGTCTLDEAPSITALDMRTGNTTTLDTSGTDFAFTTSGSFTLTAGTFIANASTITVGTDVLIASGATFTPGTSTVVFNGSSGTSSITLNGESLNDVQVNGAGATYQLADAFSCADLTVTAGTFNSLNEDMACTGDVDLSGGTVDLGTSEVTLGGSGTQTITSGGNTFEDVTFTNTSAGGVVFDDALDVAGALVANAAAADITITLDETATHQVNDLTGLTGSGAFRVKLRSQVAGNAVDLSSGVSGGVDHVDVQDSNLSGATLTVANGTDSGNNSSNWVFGGTSISGAGGRALILDLL